VSAFLITWALLAATFTGVALFRLRRRKPSAPAGELGPVWLIRPVDAAGLHELEALRAPLPLGVHHLVASPERPRDLPESVQWVKSDPPSGNRKVGHVLVGASQAPPNAVIVCVDADVQVDEALVVALVGAIRSGAHAASAAPQPAVGASLGSLCVRGLLVQSHHSFVALDAMQTGAKAICGKALAFSYETLAEWRQLNDVVGEDLELSKVLHAKGRSVVLVEAKAHVLQAPHLSMRDVVNRFTRWMQVLRAHRPALFPSVPVFFAPTPMVLLGAALASSPSVWAAVVTLVFTRVALAARLDRGLRIEWFLAECLLLVCWLNSLLLGRTLTWRGRRYRLHSGGHLS
jgi:hypothetical protein